MCRPEAGPARAGAARKRGCCFRRRKACRTRHEGWRHALYLRDMTETADEITGFLAGFSEEQFLAGDLRQSAVLQKLSARGEAAARLSSERKAAAP